MRARAAVYLLAGVYLLYLTYSMFKDIGNSTGSEYVLMLVFLVLFAIVGVGLLVFSLYLNYDYTRKKSAEAQNVSEVVEEQKQEAETDQEAESEQEAEPEQEAESEQEAE